MNSSLFYPPTLSQAGSCVGQEGEDYAFNALLLPSPLLSQVFVDQPTVPATISILRGLRER